MDAAATVMQVLGSPRASAEVYGAVADVSVVAELSAKIAAVAKNKAQVIRLAVKLRSANRSIQGLLNLVHEAEAGRRPLATEREPVSPQQFQNVVDNLDHVTRMIDYLSEMMRRAGLANNSLTAGSLLKFQGYSEPLKDLVDWLDALAKREQLDAIFERARRERERGEVVDLAQIE